ncbi:unnamed protein product [Adineta ricciae]|uniref:Uncharacterized protein n=1 Tax=Adineta ricciae TaxID=249248 RepID=A0A815CTN5_ADIRI|nr:unnamed protein product [Adineta ricciae]CAF1291658.1 unnamed protein product [Adineta ricciae]
MQINWILLILIFFCMIANHINCAPLLFENNALNDIAEGLVDDNKSAERGDSSENKQKILEANELISTSSEESNNKQEIILSDYMNTEQQNIRENSDEQLNEFFFR